jgi:hypothetical protein
MERTYHGSGMSPLPGLKQTLLPSLPILITTMTQSYMISHSLVIFPPQTMKTRLPTENNFAHAYSMSYCRNRKIRTHVTSLFNGAVKKSHLLVKIVSIASPKVATYDLMPEMFDRCIDSVATTIAQDKYDFAHVVSPFPIPLSLTVVTLFLLIWSVILGNTSVLKQLSCQIKPLNHLTLPVKNANVTLFITSDHVREKCC